MKQFLFNFFFPHRFLNKICNISPICFTHYFIMASTENNQYLIVRLFQQITDFQTIYVFHLYVSITNLKLVCV